MPVPTATPEKHAANVTAWKWDQKNTRMYKVKLNYRNDADILDHLKTISNVQGYIKSLVRADMEARAEHQP